MDASPEQIWESLARVASGLGFDYAGVAKAGRVGSAGAFTQWLESGYQGGMEWMGRNTERRLDVREVLAGARSIIVLGMGYYEPGRSLPGDTGRIARYAWGDDYHSVLEEKLKDMDEVMQVYGGVQRYYVDAGPVMERNWAQEAGLGWMGKSGLFIRPGTGSYTFLATILTTLELPSGQSGLSRCGFCQRCMDQCPTGAIVEPYVVDARRCLSYLTIENKGDIPEEFRRVMGNRIYGCDVCLAACPWNRRPPMLRESAFQERRRDVNLPLKEYLTWTEEDFRNHFRQSPIKRVKWRGFMRNVCVAAGNVGDMSYLPLLEELSGGEDTLVAEHARWAIREIRSRQ